jgi:hypothetical protein
MSLQITSSREQHKLISGGEFIELILYFFP